MPQAQERPLLGAGMVRDFSGAIQESTQLHQWRENTVSLRNPSAQDVWFGEQTMNSCVLAGRTEGWGGWGGQVSFYQ